MMRIHYLDYFLVIVNLILFVLTKIHFGYSFKYLPEINS